MWVYFTLAQGMSPFNKTKLFSFCNENARMSACNRMTSFEFVS